MKVETVMTQNVIALQPEDVLATAMDEMQKKRIRHLPIINKKGEFVGLVSHRDLLAASASILSQDYSKSQKNILDTTPIKKIMHKRVRTTTPDADLREVALIMLENKWGCLPVLRGKILAGIITASDFLMLAINLLSLHAQFEKGLAKAKAGLPKK